jgi:hypothetical protein
MSDLPRAVCGQCMSTINESVWGRLSGNAQTVPACVSAYGLKPCVRVSFAAHHMWAAEMCMYLAADTAQPIS